MHNLNRVGPTQVSPGHRHCLLASFAFDDEALDLRRLLVQRHRARVAEVALDRKLGEISVPAEDLHGVVGGAVGRLRREQLRHRRRQRQPAVFCPGAFFARMAAARNISSRAASISVDMSATIH